ncbi:ABC transporter substrate-binding protein [Aquimarina sp. AU474]|uniref:ABC transporter substrate-binding protein n=1 Tax=Aquimarina sp. AU474 TaxID=2108529 RepID=UPI000D69D475|nr:helical backbone metal receptor [Aquimarina sp. AU474]
MIFIDQMSREVEILNTPKRIVSLVPSQTELLIALGLKDSIVGITKFCVHPSNLRKEKTVVGGTKKINYDVLEKLNPDIILCNKEENSKEIVEYLEKEYPVHVSDIFSVSDALEMTLQYGEMFKKQTLAKTLVSEIKMEEESFRNFIKDKPKKQVAYFIWKNPWMAAGKNTFIDYLLKENGFTNVFDHMSRYPEVSDNDIASLPKLDLILLSSEPFPFAQKHIDDAQKTYPSAKVILVDGEYFSWYGSRLRDAFSYFKTLH